MNPDGSCTVKQATHSVRQLCVRGDFSHRYEFTIGVELHANLFVYEHDRFQEDLIFAQRSCIPISGFGFRHHEQEHGLGFDVNYWDVILGIRNPAVFHTPGNCRRQ